MSTLRVCALYPDLMNIYADRGNLLVLERRCAWRGIGIVNSYYKESGSYLRMKTLLIGYNIQPALLKKIGIDKLRIYTPGS